MAQPPFPLAQLTGDMVRTRLPVRCDEAEVATHASAGWKDDLRLFGFTWLAGFVFFFAYLS